MTNNNLLKHANQTPTERYVRIKYNTRHTHLTMHINPESTSLYTDKMLVVRYGKNFCYIVQSVKKNILEI